MSTLHTLPKTAKIKYRRVGRGIGSGRGKTAGRGTKGQKARGTIRPGFEGGQLSLIKRLPLYRGKLKNRSYRARTLVINVKILELLPTGTVVDSTSLVKHNILHAEDVAIYKIKILGDGKITKSLTVKLPLSKSAEKKIIAAGGKIEKISN